MQMSLRQLVCCTLLGHVAAQVVYVYECAAPVPALSVSSSTVTSPTALSSTPSGIANTVNPINNSGSSTTTTPVTLSSSASFFVSSSSTTSTIPGASSSSSPGNTASYISTPVIASSNTIISSSTSTFSSAVTTTVSAVPSAATTSTTSTSLSSIGLSPTTTPITTTTITTTNSAAAITTSPIPLPSGGLGPSVRSFTVTAGDSIARANGAVLQGVQADYGLLVFNPFEPGLFSVQAYQIEASTGYVYDGKYRLCVNTVQNSDPVIVTTCDPAATTPYNAPIRCTVSAQGQLQCNVAGNSAGALYTAFSLYSDVGNILELYIGTVVPSPYIPVNLYVGYL